MLDTVDKKINLIRSLSINSRGQPRQWEYQMGTGDNPPLLYYNQIFQSTYCLKKHGIMVEEWEETNPFTYAEQEKDMGKVFPQF